MKLMSLLKQTSLVVMIAALSTFVSIPAQAGMVGTVELAGNVQILNASELKAQRDWIQRQLEANGVSANDAALRVSSLSDQQVQQVQQRLEEMPAGAGVGTVLVIGFVVLVITDLVGLTDVFPFIRPAK